MGKICSRVSYCSFEQNHEVFKIEIVVECCLDLRWVLAMFVCSKLSLNCSLH